jgi:hypothetical protein
VIALVAACGGGGTDSAEEANAVFVSLPSVSLFDGYVQDSILPAFDLPQPNGSLGIAVGELEGGFGDLSLRGFVRFDLSAIPPGATVLAAVLRLYQADADHAFVNIKLGNVLVQRVHLTGATQLEAADYGVATLDTLGILSTSAVIEYKTLDVTAAVATEVGSQKIDFRLRFQTEANNDGASDSVQFEDRENHLGTGFLPELQVTYR